MRNHHAAHRLPLLVAILAIALFTLLPDAAPQARPKFYLGVGPATTSASGDFDGDRFYTSDPVNGPFIFPGKLETGNGISLTGGVLPNPNLALEILFTVTRHDSSHTAFGSENLSATLTSLLAGVRGILPLSDSFELFGKAGLGPYNLSYDGNTTLTGSPVRLDSTFSGFGIALGGGVTMLLDPIGIELSYMVQSVRFDSLDAADQTGTISTAKERFGTFNLILTINFGDEVE